VRSWFTWIEGEDTPVSRRNFFANVMDGALFAFAMSFVSLQTVLPVFVQQMGGSNIAIGLIPVLWMFGFNFPQMLIVRRAQRLPRKKKLFMKTSLIQRIPWLLLALMCFFVLEELSTGAALMLFFIAFTLAAVGGSINLPIWFDLVAKITPVRIRGRLFAIRSVLGAILGILGGVIVTFVLSVASYPDSYGILFLLAFVSMMVSYAFLGMLQETNDSQVKTDDQDQHLLAAAHRILKSNHNFRRFLVADALLIGSSMAHTFFAVNALKKFSLTEAYVGAFTIVIMVSTIVGSLLLGFLADHFGHKLNLLMAASSTLLASLLAILSPWFELYLLVFVLSAFAVAVGIISRLPLIAELCTEAERPTYVALANVITSPFILFGILAGWLADLLGYGIVFILAAVLSSAAMYWSWKKVVEPRHQMAPMMIA
jgi:MFS family permease